MASAVEKCFLDQSCDDVNVDEFSNIDTTLVMSLLEDLEAEDGDDEMVRAMIQSLQPEIVMNDQNQDSCSETDDAFSSEDCRLFSDESCSTSPDHHPDFEWLDMEMEMEMEMEMDYICPNYEMTGYLTGRFTGNMVEINIGGLEEDYSQLCYGMPMEEDDYIGLWQ